MLSPIMFSVVGEKIMHLVVDETGEGIWTGVAILPVKTSEIYTLPMIPP